MQVIPSKLIYARAYYHGSTTHLRRGRFGLYDGWRDQKEPPQL